MEREIQCKNEAVLQHFAPKKLDLQDYLDAPSSGDLESEVLTFNMQQQTENNWCWAATAVSVEQYYAPGSTTRQCDVANMVLFQNTCCNNPVPAVCDRPARLEDALTRVGHLETWSFGKTKFTDIIKAIKDDRRPLCLRVEWNGGGGAGHFVTIIGYTSMPSAQIPVKSIAVEDPLFGPSGHPYGTFPHDYEDVGGTWTTTYWTQP